NASTTSRGSVATWGFSHEPLRREHGNPSRRDEQNRPLRPHRRAEEAPGKNCPDSDPDGGSSVAKTARGEAAYLMNMATCYPRDGWRDGIQAQMARKT